MRASDVALEAPDELAMTQAERVEALAEFPLRQAVSVPIHLLRHASRNPRRGAVADVIESLREFGQHRPVVVQASTAEVIVGNHLFAGAKRLGWSTIDVFLVDDDNDKALRRGVADNATGDRATWDKAELAEVLEDTGAVPGFDDRDIARLLKQLADAGESADPTHPLMPELHEKYETVLILALNETDWAWLQTRLELRSERSYKSSAVQRAHVVTVERLQELWGA